jgi:hypothetical protein
VIALIAGLVVFLVGFGLETVAHPPSESVTGGFAVLFATAAAAVTFLVAFKPRLRMARTEAKLLLRAQGVPARAASTGDSYRAYRRSWVLAGRWASTGLVEIALGFALAWCSATAVYGWRIASEPLAFSAPIGLIVAIVLPMLLRAYTLWPLGWLFTRPRRSPDVMEPPAVAVGYALLVLALVVAFGSSPVLWGGVLAGVALVVAILSRTERYVALAAFLLVAPAMAQHWVTPLVGDDVFATILLVAAGLMVSGLAAYAGILLRSRGIRDRTAMAAEKLEHGLPEEQALGAWLLGLFAAYKHVDRLLQAALSPDEWVSFEAVMALEMLAGPPPDVRHQWAMEFERRSENVDAISPHRVEELRRAAEHEAWDHVRAFRAYVSSAASLDPLVAANAAELLATRGWIGAVAGARILGMIGSEQTVADLLDAIGSGPRVPASAAAAGFAFVRPEHAAELEDLAGNERAHVRIDALSAIVALVRGARDEGPEAYEAASEWALPVFDRASRHPSAGTRLRAALASPVLGEKATEIGRRLLDDPAWGVRAGGMIALCRIGAPGWREAAAEGLREPHAWVRQVAERLLAEDE